jgi:hypothetical protein
VPEAERAMAKSLERCGQLSPVVVCRRGLRCELIDGFKRLAVEELAWAAQLPDLAHLIRREDIPRIPQRLPCPLTAEQNRLIQELLAAMICSLTYSSSAPDEFAYENRAGIVNTQVAASRNGIPLKHLGMTVLSSLQRSQPAPKIFLDCIGQAELAHATQVYGRATGAPGLVRGDLAPWQARRAREFLRANLGGDVSLASVAAECNLSMSHFAHAFRRTFGGRRADGSWNGA